MKPKGKESVNIESDILQELRIAKAHTGKEIYLLVREAWEAYKRSAGEAPTKKSTQRGAISVLISADLLTRLDSVAKDRKVSTDEALEQAVHAWIVTPDTDAPKSGHVAVPDHLIEFVDWFVNDLYARERGEETERSKAILKAWAAKEMADKRAAEDEIRIQSEVDKRRARKKAG